MNTEEVRAEKRKTKADNIIEWFNQKKMRHIEKRGKKLLCPGFKKCEVEYANEKTVACTNCPWF